MKKESNIRERYRNKKLIAFQVLIDYLDSDGNKKQLSKTFNIKKYISHKIAYEEAKKYRNEMLLRTKALSLNTVYVPLKLVFSKYLEQSTSSSETLRKNQSTYANYLSDFSDMNIKDIKPLTINDSLKNHAKTCSKNTLKRIATLWRLLFKVALLNEYILNDFTNAITVPESQAPKKKKDVLISDKDLKKLIDYLSESDNQNHKVLLNLINLILLTGLRPAEAYGLKKDNIDFKNNILKINGMVALRNRKPIYIERTKTEKSTRNIPLTKELKKLLKELVSNTNCEYLFSMNDNPLNTIFVSYAFNKISEHLNIDFRLYMLRHRFSTKLILSGVDVRTVMDLMGHSNASMSIEYARSNNDEMLEALSKL